MTNPKPKPKHTPGPWQSFHTPSGYYWIESGVKESRCDSDLVGVARIDTDNEADAHLIAAAPEMLEALINMEKLYMTLLRKSGSVDDSIAFAARNAIAKATGGAE